MASAKEVVIGGRRFFIGLMSASKALEVEFFLARAIGEHLLKLIVMANNDTPEFEQAAAFGAAISSLTRNVKHDEMLAVMKDVFSTISCEQDGKAARIDFDATFAGHPRQPWELFVAACRENFTDFFPDAPSTSPVPS